MVKVFDLVKLKCFFYIKNFMLGGFLGLIYFGLDVKIYIFYFCLFDDLVMDEYNFIVYNIIKDCFKSYSF